jgi:hypothetical protein
MQSHFAIIIGALSVAIVILLVVIIATVLGFDWFGLLKEPLSTDVFQPLATSSDTDTYQSYELGYDGMVLPIGSGVKSVDDSLKAYPIVYDCKSCSSCSPVDFTGEGVTDTLKCDSCGECSGDATANKYKSCYGCSNGECYECDDTSEYTLCMDIKNCIYDSYADRTYKQSNGCLLSVIQHAAGTSFDLSTLRSVLSTCSAESLMTDKAGGVMTELCYFDPTSISYYDNPRPHEFYMKKSLVPEISQSYSTQIAQIGKFKPDSNDRFMPFYIDDSGQPQSRYMLYVVGGTVGSPIYVKMGSDEDKTDTGTKVESGGTMVYLNPKTWLKASGNVNNPSMNKIDYVYVESYGVSGVSVYSIFPESSDSWSNDLRYSKCNFASDPEPHLASRPWWTSSESTMYSSWTTTDNKDSAIKVYFDSSMPAAGVSDKRGNIKLQLGRLDTDLMKKCKFDIYVCPQDAFAETENDLILGINEFMSNFNPSSTYKKVDIGTNQIIIYNTFEMNLDKEYDVEEIKSALETGFRGWEQGMFVYANSLSPSDWLSTKNNEGILQDSWQDVAGSVGYDQNCWDDWVTSMMSNEDMRFIISNCDGGKCSGSLKIRLAFKYVPGKNPLYPTISFCSKNSQTVVVPDIYDGLVGGCEEVSNAYDPFTSNLCQYNWGSGSCSGSTCTCNDGVKTPISDYDQPGGKFRRAYGCLGKVQDGKDRITGTCTLSENDPFIPPKGTACNNIPLWGDTQCSSNVCSVKAGSSQKSLSTDTILSSQTTSTPRKLLGTCQYVIERFMTVGSPPFGNLGREYCQYAWGTANCNGGGYAKCGCSSGTPTEINYDKLSIFESSIMPPVTRMGSATLWGCVM